MGDFLESLENALICLDVPCVCLTFPDLCHSFSFPTGETVAALRSHDAELMRLQSRFEDLK